MVLARRDLRDQAAKPLVRRIAVHARVPYLYVAERHEFDRRPQQSGSRNLRRAVRKPFRQCEYQVGILDHPSSRSEIRGLQPDTAVQAHFFERTVYAFLAVAVRASPLREKTTDSGRASKAFSRFGWLLRTTHMKSSSKRTSVLNSLGAEFAHRTRSSAFDSSCRKTLSCQGKTSTDIPGASLHKDARSIGKKHARSIVRGRYPKNIGCQRGIEVRSAQQPVEPRQQIG